MPDRRTTEITLFSGTYTASSNSEWKHVEYFTEGQLLISVTAFTGNTLDLNLQVSDENDADAQAYNHPSVSVTQITGTGNVMYPVTNIGKYMRAAATLDVTTLTMTVKLVCKN